MWKFSPRENFHQFANACRWQNFFREFFLHSENFDTFTHAYIYVHSNLRAPPTTSWKVTRVIGEIKFGEIFVPIYSMSLWRKF